MAKKKPVKVYPFGVFRNEVGDAEYLVVERRDKPDDKKTFSSDADLVEAFKTWEEAKQ